MLNLFKYRFMKLTKQATEKAVERAIDLFNEIWANFV